MTASALGSTTPILPAEERELLEALRRGDEAAFVWLVETLHGSMLRLAMVHVGDRAVAERLGMAPIRVYEVATFYLMFNTRRIGAFHLQVCGTTPCWLRGSDEVFRACKDAGHLKGYGDTSPDGLFTLTEVECLGGCVNAPVLQVDDDYYEDLDYDSTVRLIDALRRGERPPPGSAIGRQASAPIGERTTLLDVPGE